MRRNAQNIVKWTLMGALGLSVCHCDSGGSPAPTVSEASSGAVVNGSSENGSTADAGTTTDTESNPDASPVTEESDVWPLGLTASDWQVVYDGDGTVTFDADGILMTPKAATSSSETHAALLLSQKTLTQPLQNFKATITYTNIAQLRTGTPNAWEVFWFFFNYTLAANGKKETNYVVLKPSGVEIGKAFDEVGQEFLLANSLPAIQIGETHTVTVTKDGPRVTILLDGVLAAEYESAASPKDLYDVPGSIGLYIEDAQVRVSAVTIERLP